MSKTIGERIDPTDPRWILDETGAKRYEDRAQLEEDIKRLTDVFLSTKRALETFYQEHTESTEAFMRAVQHFARSSSELERALRLLHGLNDTLIES